MTEYSWGNPITYDMTYPLSCIQPLCDNKVFKFLLLKFLKSKILISFYFIGNLATHSESGQDLAHHKAWEAYRKALNAEAEKEEKLFHLDKDKKWWKKTKTITLTRTKALNMIRFHTVFNNWPYNFFSQPHNK
jgi:hypothetical protein